MPRVHGLLMGDFDRRICSRCKPGRVFSYLQLQVRDVILFKNIDRRSLVLMGFVA